MLRPVRDQPGLWESTLPPALLVLPELLARVDELLDDPAFSLRRKTSKAGESRSGNVLLVG